MTVTAITSKQTITDKVCQFGTRKAQASHAATLRLSWFAGVFISLAYVFYITVVTGSDALPWGLTRLLGGLAFSTGLILVVTCSAELFTSAILMAVAWRRGRISATKMVTKWGLTLVGNMLGAASLLVMVWIADLPALAGGEWGQQAITLASHKVHHSWGQAFVLAILCNLLVCLATWMTFTTNSSGGKAWLMVLPVALFVSTGFEHSIANLFVVPLGVLLDTSTNVSTSSLTIQHFVKANFIPVLLGNIAGGMLLLGLADRQLFTNKQTLPTKEATMDPVYRHYVEQRVASDLLCSQAPTLSLAMSMTECLRLFRHHQQPSMAVLNESGKLEGVVDRRDLLRFYWADELEASDWQVKDILRASPSVQADTTLMDILEALTVNSNKLYPTTESGILLGQYLPFESRLRLALAECPDGLPVLNGKQYIGLITSRQLIALLSQNQSEQSLQATA